MGITRPEFLISDACRAGIEILSHKLKMASASEDEHGALASAAAWLALSVLHQEINRLVKDKLYD
jgi:hypothetical protein